MFPFSRTESVCRSPQPPSGRHPAESGKPGEARPSVGCSFTIFPCAPLTPTLNASSKALSSSKGRGQVRSGGELFMSEKGRRGTFITNIIYSSFLVFSDCPALCLGPPAASVGSWRHSQRVAEAVCTLVLPALTGTSKVSLGERAAAAGGGGATMTPDTGDSYSSFRFQLKLRCLRKSLNLRQRQSIRFSPITLVP